MYVSGIRWFLYMFQYRWKCIPAVGPELLRHRKREANTLADAVANHVLDAGLAGFSWFNEAMGRMPRSTIYIVSTDGAFRRGGKGVLASAGIVVQACFIDEVSSESVLVTLAVYGVRLSASDSLEAEFEACSLGMQTFIEVMYRCREVG